MGRVLQIRVSASTYRPEDVKKNWPRLFNLAWPEADVHEPVGVGVLELIDRLSNESRLGDWPKERKQRLEPGVSRLVYLKQQLEAALGDWKPQQANSLSNDLEGLLDELEETAVQD